MAHPRMNTKLSTGSVVGRFGGPASFESFTRPTTVTRAHCFHLGGNVDAFGTTIQ